MPRLPTYSTLVLLLITTGCGDGESSLGDLDGGSAGTDGGATTGDAGETEGVPAPCADAVKTWGPPVTVEVLGVSEPLVELDVSCTVSAIATGDPLVTTLACTGPDAAEVEVVFELPVIADDPGAAWAIDDVVSLRYVNLYRCDVHAEPGALFELRAADDTLLVAGQLAERGCFDIGVLDPVDVAFDDQSCVVDPTAPHPAIVELGDAQVVSLVAGGRGEVTLADGSRYAAAVNVAEAPGTDAGDGVSWYGVALRRLP